MTAELKLKLTARQHAFLRQMPDWSAPFEIVERLGLRLGEVGATAPELRRTLRRLLKLGLCDYSLANNTYRTTDLGREALRQTQGAPNA